MLLYTAPTPCTFDGSTADAQSCCTCSCPHFVGSCSHAAQLHKQSCAKLSRYSTRPSFARLWLFAVLVLETFSLGTLRLECDSAVLPLYSDTTLFHWIIQSRSGRRTHCTSVRTALRSVAQPALPQRSSRVRILGGACLVASLRLQDVLLQ